jgi:hypothetical protein
MWAACKMVDVVDFTFFESLSRDEGDLFLQNFLDEMRKAMPGFLASASAEGLTTDFSLDSLSPLFAWVSASLTIIPLEADPELPEWIRSSDTYADNLFDFDEPSKITVLRSAYYLGESFTRSYPSLTWAVGRRDTAPQQQPVVSGFQHTMEMPVLLVAENMLRRSHSDGPDGPGIVVAVRSWSSKV